MAAPEKSAVKIGVECPHCGFQQMESAVAKTTFCRKCGKHFDVEQQLLAEEPATREGLLKKFSTIFATETSRTIECFECQAQQSVSSAAKSSICPHCSAYIDLRDFKITAAFARNITTQGCVHVGSKGNLTSNKVLCGSANIQGKMHGNLYCTGTTQVKMKGQVFGSVQSQHLLIEKGADVEFVRPAKVGSAEILGKVSARINAAGVVSIRKTGAVEGTVYARGITVDQGGIFHGELFIGGQELLQPELLSDEEAEPSVEGSFEEFGHAG